jgi:hypothetical protein
MCFFSAPQQPNIVYQGPSEEDIQRNQASLDSYKKQVGEQQSAFQAQLQQQIEAANAETAKLQKQYQDDAAAASAAAAAQQTGAYAATASQSAPPATAQTTAATVKKEKPKANLKISLAGTPSSAGSGLNIGV